VPVKNFIVGLNGETLAGDQAAGSTASSGEIRRRLGPVGYGNPVSFDMATPCVNTVNSVLRAGPRVHRDGSTTGTATTTTANLQSTGEDVM
jgi:hypothetical protein